MTDKHPWDEFLDARYKAIIWLTEQDYDDAKIAYTLSMDVGQVASIKQRMNMFNHRKNCKHCNTEFTSNDSENEVCTQCY